MTKTGGQIVFTDLNGSYSFLVTASNYVGVSGSAVPGNVINNTLSQNTDVLFFTYKDYNTSEGISNAKVRLFNNNYEAQFYTNELGLIMFTNMTVGESYNIEVEYLGTLYTTTSLNYQVDQTQVTLYYYGELDRNKISDEDFKVETKDFIKAVFPVMMLLTFMYFVQKASGG